MEPSTLPTPSVKRFMMADNSIPLVNPMKSAASAIARIGFTLKRAMRRINPATAIKVNSNKLVSWLKPGMVATVRSRFKVQVQSSTVRYSICAWMGWCGWIRLDWVGLGWTQPEWSDGQSRVECGVWREERVTLPFTIVCHTLPGLFYPLARKPCVIAGTYKTQTR
jgi:hypothetical protein